MSKSMRYFEPLLKDMVESFGLDESRKSKTICFESIASKPRSGGTLLPMPSSCCVFQTPPWEYPEVSVRPTGK